MPSNREEINPKERTRLRDASRRLGAMFEAAQEACESEESAKERRFRSRLLQRANLLLARQAAEEKT